MVVAYITIMGYTIDDGHTSKVPQLTLYWLKAYVCPWVAGADDGLRPLLGFGFCVCITGPIFTLEIARNGYLDRMIDLSSSRRQAIQRPLFSPEHLAERTPVWVALSELWLDTELGPLEWDMIARVLAASPYSEPELAAIHHFEVAPVLWTNLCNVAGEWAGFDETWLQNACAVQAARRSLSGLNAYLLARIIRYFTHADWQAVMERVKVLRSTPIEP